MGRKKKEKEKVMRTATAASMTSVAETAVGKQEQANDSIEGEAVILYLSGDKYVGHVKDGKKNGLGMYVYADLTAYKGQWNEDTIMDGVKHPVPEGDRSDQVRKLHELNENNQSRVGSLKAFANSCQASS